MRTRIAIAGAAALASLALVACDGTASTTTTPAHIHLHGAVSWASIASSCQMDEIAGHQLRVTDSSGHVLATVDLPVKPVPSSIIIDGATVPIEKFGFNVTVPLKSRYGLTIGSIAPYYITQVQAQKSVDLSC